MRGSLKASRSEIAVKEKRVREFLEQRGLSALCLTTSKNFAWFTCGGDNHVEITNRRGVSTAVLTAEGKYLVTNNIEGGRMAAEEVEGQGFEVRETPWYEDRRFEIIRDLVGKGRIGTDWPFPGAEMVDDEISPLRYSLTKEEIHRYREVGRLTGLAVERACRQVRPGRTEHEIGSLLARNLLASGVLPAVILIAADKRIQLYRHPIPTEKKVGKCAMLVACGRKWGLIASATRLVCFGKVPRELAGKHQACTKIDAGFISRTREGRPISWLLSKAIEDYAATGYADQWRFHHQGGATGYQTRDFLATMSSTETVKPNQAFAWNPSIAGTKSEDTIICTQNGALVVTQTRGWPTIVHEVDGVEVQRPDILAL